MNEYEIFLNRTANSSSLYSEITEKLSLNTENPDIEEFFRNADDNTKLKVYISNEDIQNPELDDIINRLSAYAADYNIPLEIIDDEFLNILDESDRITSVSKPRTVVHKNGDLHPTVHTWIIKRRDMGVYVLLQKRSDNKEIHPGCYDISSAGHVTQGGEYRSAALRELYEELGIEVSPASLEYIGKKKNYFSSGDIIDNEYSSVYLYRGDVDIDNLVLQKSEVSEVCWAEIDELLSVMPLNKLKHCISPEELLMIKKAVF
jgi:isopentenyldiphosphate isomerase